jgi:hypothetical protein
LSQKREQISAAVVGKNRHHGEFGGDTFRATIDQNEKNHAQNPD